MSTAPVHACCPTPLGTLLLAATPAGLCGAWFTEQQRDTPDPRDWPLAQGDPFIDAAIAQLTEYFNGQRRDFELLLDLSAGTLFQQAVWRALLGVPAGTAITYGELAVRTGRPDAVRASGSAVGRNPLSIIVPCHRILGQGQSLNGYGGGLPRKVALLALEGWQCSDLPATATVRSHVRPATGEASKS